jgi:hypothetical protein
LAVFSAGTAGSALLPWYAAVLAGTPGAVLVLLGWGLAGLAARGPAAPAGRARPGVGAAADCAERIGHVPGGVHVGPDRAATITWAGGDWLGPVPVAFLLVAVLVTGLAPMVDGRRLVPTEREESVV